MLFENQRTNTIIVSIIWGLGVATLFRKICNNNKCIVVKSPSDMNSYYEQNKKKCYNFTKEKVDC